MLAPHRLRAAAICGLLGLGTLAACTDNATPGNATGASANPRAVTVQATDDACALSSTTVPAGSVTFTVTNAGSSVTEFYLYGADGKRVVGEVENIGPGLSRDLVARVSAGEYVTACKPGMAGEGIRGKLTVTEAGDAATTNADAAELERTAVKAYHSYVYAQAEALVEETEEFAAAYTAGRDDEAREIYPEARAHWERIETVAESFGDLDPKLDLREADLEPGQVWTGWHRLEKDLWPARAKNYTALTDRQRTRLATQLVADTEELEERIEDLDFTVDQIANGSRGLLDEVATGKVTGEEEYWSRTDLWDFQANVDGAREAFETLRPLVDRADADLGTRTERAFDDLQKLLDGHRKGEGFVGYDTLTPAQVKALSDAVNALGEPLSQLTAAIA